MRHWPLPNKQQKYNTVQPWSDNRSKYHPYFLNRRNTSEHFDTIILYIRRRIQYFLYDDDDDDDEIAYFTVRWKKLES